MAQHIPSRKISVNVHAIQMTEPLHTYSMTIWHTNTTQKINNVVKKKINHTMKYGTW